MGLPEFVSSKGESVEIKPHRRTILLVDDTRLNLRILETIFKDEYNLPTAQNGETGWTLLEAFPELYDVVLLDRMMPDIMGEEVLKRMQRHDILKHTPVVFQTALASKDDIKEGFELGVDYYITKPFDDDQVAAIVKTAIHKSDKRKAMHQEMQKAKAILSTFSLADSGSLDFKVRSLHDAEYLALMLSNACPDPENASIGLSELIFNAIEHGIAKITYDEKTDLNTEGTWMEEVERRLVLPENLDKYAIIRIDLIQIAGKTQEIRFQVKDPGEGFDHQKYREVDETRMFDNHGRGIAMGAQLSFDELLYNEKGNEVTAIIKV